MQTLPRLGVLFVVGALVSGITPIGGALAGERLSLATGSTGGAWYVLGGAWTVRGANPGMKRRDSGFEGRFGAPLQGLRGEQWACGRSLASEVREPGNVFGTRDAQAVTEVAPE